MLTDERSDGVDSKMIYKVLLALKDATLLKSLAQEIHARRIPCHVSAFQSIPALIESNSFDYADAVLLDASLLKAGALTETLLRGAMGRRTVAFGRVPNERTARILAEAGVQCQAANSEDALCDALEAMLIEGQSASSWDAVRLLLESLPLSATLKGSRYIETALHLALRIPALMDSLKDGLYARVAERCSASPASVERDIRYAIGQCWYQMEARQKRALMPRGTNRPAPKLFLTQLLRRLSQQQRETEALWPSAVPHEKAPHAPSVYRKRRSK